jgi:hypothetical protein
LINANQISVPPHEIDGVDSNGELFDKEVPALKLFEHENHHEKEMGAIATEKV